jgi:hypothetical protein
MIKRFLFILIISIINIIGIHRKQARETAISERLAFAFRTESRPTRPANRPSLSQILRRKYPLKCAETCHDGLGRKFCTASIGTRADFAIDRLGVRCAAPAPHVECKKVQYQYDYPRACNIFTIRAIFEHIGAPPSRVTRSSSSSGTKVAKGGALEGFQSKFLNLKACAL